MTCLVRYRDGLQLTCGEPFAHHCNEKAMQKGQIRQCCPSHTSPTPVFIVFGAVEAARYTFLQDKPLNERMQDPRPMCTVIGKRAIFAGGRRPTRLLPAHNQIRWSLYILECVLGDTCPLKSCNLMPKSDCLSPIILRLRANVCRREGHDELGQFSINRYKIMF